MKLIRTTRPELMDDPELPAEDHRQALKGLARLNLISGVAPALYRRIASYCKRTGKRQLRVLDVASGRGDLPVYWAKRAKADGLHLSITAVDISPVAIEEQQRAAKEAGVEIQSICRDCLNEPLPNGFDIVTSSLFMHHLSDPEVTRLLQSMHSVAGTALIVCDLERSRINLGLVGLASRAVTRSHVVHHDAIWSIRGAYTQVEFRKLAEAALSRPVVIKRLFPCRFVAIVDDAMVTEAAPAFA